MMHWLSHILGFDNLSGPFYGFWSGFGSDIGEVTILAAVVGAWHKVNCHTKGCLRVARYEVLGTPYKLCHRCHKRVHRIEGPIDIGHIRNAHRAATEEN